MIRKLLLFAVLPALLFGCHSSIDIENFDEAAFRGDTNGCAGERAGMKEELFAADRHLKGLTQEEIWATLGKPDRQELATRSQKYYVYYVDPAPVCTGDSTSLPLTLFVRFSAMNRASEVKYENY
ncbi:MAG: hypothetical protein WA958_16345 [Tunicatimonas sp.]